MQRREITFVCPRGRRSRRTLSGRGRLEGHGPGGEHAIGAALSALDAAIQIEEDYRPKED
jgi:hypothetical protein